MLRGITERRDVLTNRSAVWEGLSGGVKRIRFMGDEIFELRGGILAYLY